MAAKSDAAATFASSTRVRACLLAVLCGLAVSVAPAQDPPVTNPALPPRNEWRATASSTPPPGMEPAKAIDGDPATEWGGGFSPGNWLQIDLGRAAQVGGVLIHWDLAFSAAYLIQSSRDGDHWQTAYETGDSPGGKDYVFFPAVSARYLRLTAAPRTTDWGVSVFEVEPLAASDAPRITGLHKGSDPATLWTGAAHPAVVAASPAAGVRELHVYLPRLLPVTGLEVFWGSARRGARLEGREPSGRWRLLADDPAALGDRSFLAAAHETTVSELRLTVRAAPGIDPAIQRLRLLSPGQVMTTLKRYQIVASRAHRELFPSSLHGQQVYWTAVGVAAGAQKSLFDEYGDLEAVKDAPLVEPLWRDASGHTTAAYGADLKHTLRHGFLPMPVVEWSPQPGLALRAEAIATDLTSGPVTLVRYHLTNTGTHATGGQLAILVRPVQVNPPWQHGGLSAIRSVAIRGTADRPTVAVNGRVLFTSLTRAAAGGVAPFGPHGAGEITAAVADGRLPRARAAQDGAGLAAAALRYDVQLAPGAHSDVVLAFPLDGRPADLPARAGSAVDFDGVAGRVEEEWLARIDRVGISLPDAGIVDTLRAQLAYMLVNQKGAAMQAGPRNYNRSFIRDGAATAAILLRMGLPGPARDYLHWYAAHALHDSGLVSPILNDDGSVNRGFGSDIEFDSQGEFIMLVAEVARLDGGAGSVREYLPGVRRALTFLESLRARTLAPGYQAEAAAPQRFRGIIAPSISHEGYPRPTHSYWDDYWALKGWHDGAWLLSQWGEPDLARWAGEQYQQLGASVAQSIRATMAWKGLDVIPASADSGDRDPTSVSIALDPCGQQDLLPAAALHTTFARYLDEVRARTLPGALYAYTPYEFRNVLTFVRLGQPEQAGMLLHQFLAGRHPADWQVFAEVVRSQVRAPFYLGDMPHTWVGAEYVRAVIGMLMHEDDERLELLPGTPPDWVAGTGLAVRGLPTAFGTLTMSARADGATLRVRLEPGLRSGTTVAVSWPTRRRPQQVRVDAQVQSGYDANGIVLVRPFHELEARW